MAVSHPWLTLWTGSSTTAVDHTSQAHRERCHAALRSVPEGSAQLISLQRSSRVTFHPPFPHSPTEQVCPRRIGDTPRFTALVWCMELRYETCRYGLVRVAVGTRNGVRTGVKRTQRGDASPSQRASDCPQKRQNH